MIMNFPEKSTQIAFQAELISLEQIVPRESSEVEPGRRGVQKTTGEFDSQLAVSQDNRFHGGWVRDLMVHALCIESSGTLHVSQ